MATPDRYARHGRGLRTEVAVAVSQGIRVAHAISVGVYLLSSVAVVTLVGSVVLQIAANGVSFQAASTPDSTNTVNLTWTASGDDANTGTASSYVGRYAVDGLAESTWAAATPFSTPTPQSAGTTQTAMVTGLQPGVQYAFGLKSRDEAGNESALSNVATKRTDLVACTPTWSCTDWSTCRDGNQVRSCLDVRSPSCGNDFGRPIEQQQCTGTTPGSACTPEWSCSGWSACVDGRQARTCLDLQRCGVDTGRPAIDRPCGSGGDFFDPQYVIVGQAAGGRGEVRVYAAETGRRQSLFRPFNGAPKGGVEVAGGDPIHGGGLEVVSGTGPGSSPQIVVSSISGRRLTSFAPFPKKLTTGVEVAVGDVDGDGRDDLVTAPASKYPGLVRTFTYRASSKKFSRLTDFSAHGSRYRGGVNLAVQDLNLNGFAEVIVAPAGRGRGSTIEVYEYSPATRRFARQASFSAYSRSFQGGIRLATADVDGDGRAEIITSPAPGLTDIRVFTYASQKATLFKAFLAGSKSFRGGADVAGLDVNRDGRSEVLTVTYRDGASGLRTFSWNAVNRTFSRLSTKLPTYAFAASFQRGVRMASM